ncbi:tRNA nuclease WapA precursor [Clostridium homopropionicum DSM 5847]|uniref:tRNA nuclease WapA n=1 Tax=Clostridium homopropionicum DSM 5847 TaxID=1121318 RepID=A0A0L6ZCZ5_9CLOT|nr:DNRLRE domain-containing protein [Clostridium homopropionicum]KOA20845.1 tRNA nuclease WapA precursor [Clostridium homopropionicum DSM 5847]SFF87629.1 RHS repeat-associated core domain-containing protein [Clostridium homopropionicum]
MNSYKRLISRILIAFFIFTALPTQVFAETINGENKQNYVEPQFSETEAQAAAKNPPKILKEVKEKREENIKHFLLEDNTYEAVIYNDPVHYKENGEWKDIDNTLVEATDESGNSVLENKDNDFKVKISKKSNSENLISINKDKYEISWKMSKSTDGSSDGETEAPIAEVEAKVVSSNIQENVLDLAKDGNSDDDKKVLKNINSKVKYENIEDKVNLEYSIISKKVKESIVLNEKVDNPNFQFTLKTKNLTAKLNEDKSISFYDDVDNSKLIYTMEAPFMYDTKGEISKYIEILLEQKDDNYILSLLPNKEWLDSKDRVYPVIIDPTVQTPLNINSIHDSYVAEGVPNSNYGGVEFLQVGQGSTTNRNRAFISFDLPTIQSTSIVTGAYLFLYLNQANATPTQIDVHKVQGSWNSSTITWNNQPAYNPKIEDYEIVSGNQYAEFAWDITSIAKEWTSTGTNNGLMIKNHNEASGYNQFISSDSESALVELRPRGLIYYTDSTGLENYWTYHSQDIGRAGTGYVNDYNGNLVLVHNDLSMNGNKMPISLSHVFNSNERNVSNGYGNGWRLNLSQKLVFDAVTQNYVYTDEDGTKHYLVYDSTESVYKDESGIDITMTINPSSTNERYKIKDKKDNALLFTSGGYLYKIQDSNGNTLTLSYDGVVLKSITDGAGRVTKLDVSESGYLLGIIDPSNRRTSFSYDGINLSRITYPDGNYSTYTYNANNNLEYVTNFDGYKIGYIYYDVLPYRVKQIIETNEDGTPGQGINVNYGYNSTTYNDYRGKKNIYQFNNYGNTVSTRDDEGNALYYDYNTKSDTGKELYNKLSFESKLQKPIMNYLKNHNAEIVGNWTAVNDGNTNGSSTYDTTIKYLGAQALKTEKLDTLNRRFHKQQVTLTKGNTYTLSAYIKTENVSKDNKKGAAVFISYQDSSGNTQTVYSDYVSGTNEWEREEVTFTLPSNAASDVVEANVGIANESGAAYFDAIQLEDGALANRYNMLENPNFIYGLATPDFWSKNSYTDGNDTLVTSSDSSYPIKLDTTKKVFRINGSASLNKTIYQKINQSGNAGDVYVVSGWAKGDSVPLSSGRYFALDVGIEKLDGTYEWKVVPFNEDSTEWQYASAKIITGAAYKSLTFYALYYQNENTAYFDGLQLYKEEFSQSYVYDDKGNIKSVQDVRAEESQFEYQNNDVVKATNVNGGIYNYTHDAKHNIQTAISAENVKYTFEYDASGNITTSKVGETSELTVQSAAAYTTDGNYLNSIEDSSGNKVTYNYNTTKGNLDRTTDAKGNSIFYSYDSIDRLKQVETLASNGNLEVFPLEGSTTGTKGTSPSANNALFDNDENGKLVLKALDNYKLAYTLGLGISSGTMAAWVNPGTSATTRYILDSQFGGNSSMLTLYLDTSNKLNLAVRNSDGTWRTVITSTDTVTANTWNYIAFNWSKNESSILTFNLYLNDKVYSVADINAATIKDFTGATTSLGMHDSGLYSINGLMDQFIYSGEALSQTDINSIRDIGRGNYLGLNSIKNSYTYENDKIKSVSHNGFSYTFNYDGAGNNSEVNVGSQNLITNVFHSRTGLLQSSTYGNGTSISYNYDSEDRISSKLINGAEKYKYSYDASGNLGILEDLINNKTYRYIYDASDRLTKLKDSDGNIMTYNYDKGGNISTFQEKVNGIGYITSYDYDKDNRVTDIYYKNPLLNSEGTEYFPLNNSTTGSRGTKPYSIAGESYEKDIAVTDSTVKQKRVLTTSSSTKILYDLGLKQSQGTMGVWLNTKGGATNRYILASEGNGSLLTTYLDSNSKLNLAVRNASGSWLTLITSTDIITLNTWNYAAFTWSVSGATLNVKLYLNDKVYSGSTTSFKDFTGAKTAVGSTVAGSNQLNGQLEGLTYYNTELSSEEINEAYSAGRGNKVNYKYDAIGRVTDRTLSTGVIDFITKYSFETGKTVGSVVNTTTKVKEIDNNGNKIAYTYDPNGNIATITENGKVINYTYDQLNQLTREDNQVLNKTITYSYDAGGNILSKTEYPYTTGTPGTPLKTYNYEYTDINWKDKLTSFDGKPITYDAIGNPLTYDGYTFTWEQGRQLQSLNGNGKNISYKYNADGIRTEKTVNGVTTKYHLAGDKVTYEDNGVDKIYYTYDSDENLVSMNLNGVEYYYIRNAQGDIIGLFDKNGSAVASYTYDSWGKLISIKDGSGTDITNNTSSVGYKNPYRYRGYRYDTETGLYYLQSRYYNPEWGRFLNVDEYVGKVGTLLSANMFAYCLNNPVNLYDPSGSWFALTFPSLGQVATGILGTITAVVSSPIAIGVALVASTGFLTYAGYRYYQSTVAADSSGEVESSSDDDVDVEIVIPRSKYPETAQHVEDAIKSGHPDKLTVDRSKAKANRKESLKDIPKVKAKDLDEYPPAMFREGGAGASVRPVVPSDNRGSGSWMGHKLRAFPDGTRVRIRVGD